MLLRPVLCFCLVFLVSGCRPPARPVQTVETRPGLSLDEPEESSTSPEQEKEPVESASKPKPAPTPAEPTAPPPTKLAGFSFGQDRKAAWQACSKKGTWKRYGEHWLCTKPLVDPGFEGSPVLSFCADKVCAIGFAIVPEGNGFDAWSAAFERVRQVFVGRYGEPTKKHENLPQECKGPGFATCLDEGKANVEASWIWSAGHQIILRMSQKKSGEGPPAIRLISLPGSGS